MRNLPAPWNESVFVGLVVIVTAIALGLLVATSNAHDALPTAAQPQGWSYPSNCCSGYDCRAVPATRVGEDGSGGYVIKATGEVVPHGDPRLRESPDGLYHWCSVAGAEDGRTRCLFVPPPSY